jgi:acetyl esterase/lipase
MKFTITLSLIACFSGVMVMGQDLVRYQQIDSTNLFLEVYQPDSMVERESYPAIIFFFGGGWKGGDRHHFLNHAKYFAKRGLVCFLADYRTWNKHQVPPFECLKDAKSAIRYIRSAAEEFQIDPNKVIASGGSAGGHLAAATALVSGFNHQNDDLSISCVPNALVLFNPVIDNGPGGYGYERVSDAYHEFSPLHNIRAGAPPTIFFLGTKDALIPVTTAEYYQQVMKKVGSRCDLKLYPEAGHGFFNYRNLEHYRQTLMEADDFLISLGYLNTNPPVNIE